MLEIFQYSFITRGIIAGLIIGFIAPLIGIFLVLRRYSLISDTLAHVSLAGVALGLLLKINPLFTAIFSSVFSSVLIEKLRASGRVFGETALSIFLSGSLAAAIVLVSIGGGFNVDIFNYLFGSIVTVKLIDIYIIAILGVAVATTVVVFLKELVYVAFDEEAAQVSGIPRRFINFMLISLSALTIALSIPIFGALLIGALVVIPVVSALQFKRSFNKTILIAEAISLFSVLSGIIVSFYLNLSSGGTIVLVNIVIFLISLFYKK